MPDSTQAQTSLDADRDKREQDFNDWVYLEYGSSWELMRALEGLHDTCGEFYNRKRKQWERSE